MAKSCPNTPAKNFLPSLPTVVFSLLEATEDESKTLRQLGQIASQDPSLSTHILKIANSPLLSPGKPIKSLSQAALNLGISTLRNLAITVAICQNFSDLELPSDFSIENFWSHSLCCGLISKKLAKIFEPTISEDEAFLAGLLHDIGQLSLIVENPNKIDKIVQNPRTGQTILDSEKKIWGRDHTEEGFSLLKNWNIPYNICCASRYHHLPEDELALSIGIVKIVFLSDIITHFFHGETTLVEQDFIKYSSSLGYDSQKIDLNELKEEIKNQLHDLAKDLGLKITSKDEIDFAQIDQCQDIKKQLQKKALDQASLIVALDTIAHVKNREEFHEAIFKALSQLMNIKSLLFLIFNKNCLRGAIARASKDDSIANQICIANLNDTIWGSALNQNTPIYSKHFFSKKTPKVIDLQIKDYLYGDFLLLPLVIGKSKIGILTLGINEEEYNRIQNSIDLLKLLSRQIAHIYQGISYKQFWEKEHIINDIVVKKSPIAIAITNTKGAILFLNPACKKLLKENPELFSEKYLFSFFKNSNYNELLDTLSEGKLINLGKINISSLSGNEKWIEAKLTCVTLFDKKRLLFLIRDVTDSVLLEKEREQRAIWLETELEKKTLELKKAQERLIQVERLGAASEIARKVVHEVNNPLNIIKNLLKIIKIQKETGKIDDKTIDTINSEIDRVSRIIKQLSDFSKKTNIKPKFSENSDIPTVIETIKTLFKDQLKENGIDLTITVEKNLPKAAISKDELKQILINLVKNAQEAIIEEGQIDINIYKDAENNKIIIEVSDTGCGIKDEIKDKIFSHFVTTKGSENFGVGLSVCYSLLKACGGDIYLSEKKGFNTVFKISLPICSDKEGTIGREDQ